MIHPASVFQRVKVVLPADLQPIYSNAALVRYTVDEFTLDFARLLPGVCRPKVDARISLTPFNATLLREALRDRLAKHERDYGVVRLTSDPDCDGDEPGPRRPAKQPPLLPPPARSEKSTSKQPAPASTGQEIDVPPNLATTYTNFAVVRSSAVDVVIDFACLPPNVFRTDICARVVASPAGAKLLLQALIGALARYEDKYGHIQPPENIGGDDKQEMPYLTLWGPPVPFSFN